MQSLLGCPWRRPLLSDPSPLTTAAAAGHPQRAPSPVHASTSDTSCSTAVAAGAVQQPGPVPHPPTLQQPSGIEQQPLEVCGRKAASDPVPGCSMALFTGSGGRLGTCSGTALAPRVVHRVPGTQQWVNGHQCRASGTRCSRTGCGRADNHRGDAGAGRIFRHAHSGTVQLWSSCVRGMGFYLATCNVLCVSDVCASVCTRHHPNLFRCQQAATQLGVGVTTLKKVCRNGSVPRWPFRKRSSLDNLIEKTAQFIKVTDEVTALNKQRALQALQQQRQSLQVG